jgi:hypothetical protein
VERSAAGGDRVIKKLSFPLFLCFLVIQFSLSFGGGSLVGVSKAAADIRPNEPNESAVKNLPGKPSEGIAVSLRVLQKKLKKCIPTDKCVSETLKLNGMTQAVGFVIDKKNRDIILIGRADKNSPALYLEDFVVALRKTWGKYVVVKDNKKFIDITPAGCSIDPHPEVIQALNETFAVDFDTFNPEHVQIITKRWNDICLSPQVVRVEGIPHNNRFAKVMVDADYLMKRLVDGSVNLEIDGFKSLTEMTLEEFKNVGDRRPQQSMSRFWFSSGESSFLKDSGATYIKTSEVILLTEEQFINKNNELADIGRKNPMAEDFAIAFSARYTEIKKAEPIYEELEGLFRFIALGKLMRHENAEVESGLSVDYLLYDFPVKETLVDITKPGIPLVKVFKKTNNRQFYCSCGGVTTDMKVDDTVVVLDKSGQLNRTRISVLRSRPSYDSQFWKYLDYLLRTRPAAASPKVCITFRIYIQSVLR